MLGYMGMSRAIEVILKEIRVQDLDLQRDHRTGTGLQRQRLEFRQLNRLGCRW